MTARGYDQPTESALLGAVLQSPDKYAVAIEAGVTATSFIGPDSLVWHGIEACADTGIDPITVGTWMVAHHGGEWPKRISALHAALDFTSANAHIYAATLVDLEHNRYVANQLTECLNGSFPSWRSKVDALCATADGWSITGADPLTSDLQAMMDGDMQPIIPEVFQRDDHACHLFYGPGINWLSGEPGEGKSLLALHAIAQVLRDGDPALLIDYEGTEQGTVGRLKEMGVTDVTGLSYVRVSEPWTPARMVQLRQLATQTRFRIAVIDAVAGAMEAEALDPESNRDVEKWVAAIPTLLAHLGAAVVPVDHVTKNKETRGRWMIGAQRKMARSDAAFNLEMFDKAGIGKTGHGKLLVAKDRYGALAEHQVGRVIAEVTIMSEVLDDGERDLSVHLTAPSGTTGTPSGPTWYMERVSRLLEDAAGPMGTRELRTAVGKKAQYVDEAIRLLAADGHIAVSPDARGNSKPWVSVRPYRQPEQLRDDAPPLGQSFYESELPEPETLGEF